MLDSFNLTRRSIVVFAVTAALALAGGAFEQAALRGQRRHYEAIGALALHRQLAVRLVRGTLLAAPAAPHGAEAGQGDAATLARHRADVAEARARLALASRILVAPDDAPENATGGTSSRALRDAAGPRASLIAAEIDTLLATATRAGAPDAGRASVEALLAAERDLLSVTIERTRAVLATTDREIAELRLAAGGVGVLLLGSLAGGLFLLVHPAARAIEAATHEATRGREFASSLVASAADAIVAFDARMRITEWNPAMERWTGVGRADALGRSPADIPAAFDWTADGPPYARALAGEATALVDVPGRAHPDAPTGYFDVTCTPLRDPSGAVSGALVTVRDVTERVEATARLRASEMRFSALYRQAPIGIAMHDDDGVISDANPAFEQLLGRPLSTLRGTRAADLSPPDDAAVTRAPTREMREGRRDAVQVEKRFVRADGSVMWASLTLCRIEALGDGTTTVGMLHDITDRKALEARLSHQAYHDPLTGLANRTRLRERVEESLARDAAGPHVAVLYVDLDDFKRVNDSLGHAAGDRLLVQAAERLLHATRGSDTVARLGGDEFAVLLERVRGDEDARVVAERVGTALRMPFRVDGTEVVVGASVGIARVADVIPGGLPDDPAAGADLILRGADVAMYAAKRGGKGRYALYEPTMNADAFARLELEADLRRAVAPAAPSAAPSDGTATDGAAPATDELCVHYQPIVDLATGRPVGAEALVRWRHPRRGLLAPGSFVPLAEDTGLVIPLGRHVLAAACAEAAAWPAPAGGGDAPTLTVNVSARQLHDPEFVGAVDAVLARTGLAPARLLLELTESVLAQHDEPTLETLRALKRLGVRLGIDDFGTGYSSLRYLQRFPVDVLKVDRSFVAGLGGATPAGAGTGSAPSVALAHAVIALGRTLSLRTVAEGVETEPQRAQLQALGCEYGQGYLFARPVAADEVRALFHAPPLPAADAATGTATGDTAAGGTAAGGTASGDAAAGDTPADGGPAGSGRTLVTA